MLIIFITTTNKVKINIHSTKYNLHCKSPLEYEQFKELIYRNSNFISWLTLWVVGIAIFYFLNKNTFRLHRRLVKNKLKNERHKAKTVLRSQNRFVQKNYLKINDFCCEWNEFDGLQKCITQRPTRLLFYADETAERS